MSSKLLSCRGSEEDLKKLNTDSNFYSFIGINASAYHGNRTIHEVNKIFTVYSKTDLEKITDYVKKQYPNIKIFEVTIVESFITEEKEL